MTDSIAVEVANVAVDTLKKNVDIKDIQPAKSKLAIGGNIFTLALLWYWSCNILVYQKIQRKKN
jgi:hypothetical protein